MSDTWIDGTTLKQNKTASHLHPSAGIFQCRKQNLQKRVLNCIIIMQYNL